MVLDTPDHETEEVCINIVDVDGITKHLTTLDPSQMALILNEVFMCFLISFR